VFTRSSQVVLVATVALGLLMSTAMTVVAARETGKIDLSAPMLSLTLAVGFGTPLIGVLIMTSDWQSREVITLFLLEPRRGVVFVGKVVATLVLAVSAVAAVILLSVAFALSGVLIAGMPLVYTTAIPEIVPLFVVCVVGAITGSALAAAILSTPLAVVAVIAQTAVVDPVLSALRTGWSDYLAPSSISDCLAGTSEPGAAIAAGAIWIVLPFALGHWRVCQREVQ
jgi:ABC-2 type transport system permease protein